MKPQMTTVKPTGVNIEGWALAEWNDVKEESPLSANPVTAASLGHHLLVELYDCDPDTIRGVETVERILLNAATASNASIVSHHFHNFLPHGVSGAVIIQESHYTVHTWPEHRYAAIDLFYCSNDVIVERAIEVLKREMRPARVDLLLVRRGRV